jgi:hypothetical protein
MQDAVVGDPAANQMEVLIIENYRRKQISIRKCAPCTLNIGSTRLTLCSSTVCWFRLFPNDTAGTNDWAIPIVLIDNERS